MLVPKHWLLSGIMSTSRGINPMIVKKNVDIEISAYDAFL